MLRDSLARNLPETSEEEQVKPGEGSASPPPPEHDPSTLEVQPSQAPAPTARDERGTTSPPPSTVAEQVSFSTSQALCIINYIWLPSHLAVPQGAFWSTCNCEVIP